jgi:hypothetical protein
MQAKLASRANLDHRDLRDLEGHEGIAETEGVEDLRET